MLIDGEFARRHRELEVHIPISPNENQSLYTHCIAWVLYVLESADIMINTFDKHNLIKTRTLL